MADRDKLEALKEILVDELGFSREKAEKEAENLYDTKFVVRTPDEAKDEVIDNISQLIDEAGLNVFGDGWDERICRFYVTNDDDFEDWLEEDDLAVINSMSEEERQKNFEEYGVDNVDDYIEKVKDKIKFDYGTFANFVITGLGVDSIDMIDIDYDGLADDLISQFGLLDNLPYEEEYETDDYYIFKVR